MKEKVIQNQAYLRKQIEENPNRSLLASDKKTKKKYLLGGQMDVEEARMNRELLKEIALKKREDNKQYSHINGGASVSAASLSRYGIWAVSVSACHPF